MVHKTPPQLKLHISYGNGSKLLEETKLHEWTKLREEKVARKVNFTRRLVCTRAKNCTKSILHQGLFSHESKHKQKIYTKKQKKKPIN